MKSKIKELFKENLTIEELMNIARRVPNHGVLVQALADHPQINFEYIEMSYSKTGFKVSRPH